VRRCLLSAAAVSVQSASPRHLAPRHCRVRPAHLTELHKHLTWAAQKIYNYLYAYTVGVAQPRCEATDEELDTVSNVSGAWRAAAVKELVEKKLVEVGIARDGKKTYTVFPPNFQAEIAPGHARCRGCGSVGTMDIDVSWRSVTHGFLTHAPAACTEAMYACLAVIIDATMRWDLREKRLIINFVKLPISRFRFLAKKARSSVQAVLNKLLEIGFIERSSKPGRANWYRPCPEKFYSGGTLGARVCPGNSNRNRVQDLGEEREKVAEQADDETKEVVTQTRPVEFIAWPSGTCRLCHYYGPVDSVTDDFGEGLAVPGSPPPDDRPRNQPRAGPIPVPSPQKEEIPGEQKELWGYLCRLEVSSQAPDAQITREIYRALDVAGWEELAEEISKGGRDKFRYLRKSQFPYRVILTIAKAVGDRARFALEDRKQAGRAPVVVADRFTSVEEFRSRMECVTWDDTEARREIQEMFCGAKVSAEDLRMDRREWLRRRISKLVAEVGHASTSWGRQVGAKHEAAKLKLELAAIGGE
jgi:hypothetical protein